MCSGNNGRAVVNKAAISWSEYASTVISTNPTTTDDRDDSASFPISAANPNKCVLRMMNTTNEYVPSNSAEMAQIEQTQSTRRKPISGFSWIGLWAVLVMIVVMRIDGICAYEDFSGE